MRYRSSRTPLRRLPLLAAVVLCFLPAAPAAGQAGDTLAVVADSTAGAPPPSPRAPTPVLAEAVLLGRASAHGLGAPLRWGRRDLVRLGAAVGGVAVVALLDAPGRDLMEHGQSGVADRVVDQVEEFGRMRGLAVLGGLFAAGVLRDDAKMRGVAAEGLASSLVAAAILQPALAGITGRPRPRQQRPVYEFDPFSGHISFPSGHTTAAFAAASVIATEYDAPLVQVLAYGLAAGVGLSRMYEGAHYVSDVTAGALLGTAVGRSVARYGQRHRDRLGIEVGAAGVRVRYAF